jgi:uncharacterized protein (UPF0333 family)
MIRKKKGQAAMEFLMTYGWAILAAVIVIGVLASFGVFSPSKYVPISCTLSAPFGCDKNQVSATTNAVSLVIRNGGGESFDISSVTIAGCGNNTTGYTLADQATQLVTITCGSNLTSGEKFSGDVSITYTPTSGGVLNMTSSGSVVVKVA